MCLVNKESESKKKRMARKKGGKKKSQQTNGEATTNGHSNGSTNGHANGSSSSSSSPKKKKKQQKDSLSTSSSKWHYVVGLLAVVIGAMLALQSNTNSSQTTTTKSFSFKKAIKQQINSLLDSLKLDDDEEEETQEEVVVQPKKPLPKKFKKKKEATKPTTPTEEVKVEESVATPTAEEPAKAEAEIEEEEEEEDLKATEQRVIKETQPVEVIDDKQTNDDDDDIEIVDTDDDNDNDESSTAVDVEDSSEASTALVTPPHDPKHPWQPMGSKLIGPQNRSQFGFAVDLSNDNVLVVGVPGWKNDTGGVLVYRYGGTNMLGDIIEDEWVPYGVADGGLLEADKHQMAYGRSVSYDAVSNKIAVGGHGIAGVYKMQDNEWVKDHPNDFLRGEKVDNGYGFQVALAGGKLVLSEPGVENTKGAVYTLEDDYETLETLLGVKEEDQSGVSLALNRMDGNILAVGSPMFGPNKELETAGHVRVLQWDDVEGWSLLGGKGIVGLEAHDWAGQSVALNGDGTIVAVGSPGHDEDTLKDQREDFMDEASEWDEDMYEKMKKIPGAQVPPGRDSGQVRVFRLDKNKNKWVPMGQDLRGEEKGDEFGYSVSLSDDGMTMAIGAIWNRGHSPEFGDRVGHVRVYRFDGQRWNQMGSDLDGDAIGDWFGQSVQLSPNGKRLAVGAICRSNGWQGYVKVFELQE